MATPHYFSSVGKAVAVDLAPLFRRLQPMPPLTPAMDAKGGSVAVADHTATFTPSQCGFASWSVQVTDKDGSKMKRTLVAFIDAGTGTCP